MGRIFLFTKIHEAAGAIQMKAKGLYEKFRSHFVGINPCIIFAIRFERKGLILMELGVVRVVSRQGWTSVTEPKLKAPRGGLADLRSREV